MSKKMFIGLIFVFAFLSFIAFKNALPKRKNKIVMNALSTYIPYKLEKRLGGLTIINTKTGTKEKPKNDVIFKRLDKLEMEWGKKHLIINGSILSIINDKNQTVKSFKLENKKQINFVHNFFKI
jgi:hypothetical protein